MRRVLLWLNFPFAWAIFLAVSGLNLLAGVLLQQLRRGDPDRRTALKVNHWIWGRALFACEPGWSTRRSGLENMGAGPYIIVANHRSVLDIPLCLGLPGPLLVRILARQSLFKVPVMGWYMRYSKHIPVDLGDPEAVRSSLKRCADTLSAGISLLIFPEGTRSEDATLGRFGRGAFRLSKDTGVPILPVVIYGSHKLMKKGQLMPDNIYHPIELRVLPSVDGAEYNTARDFSNQVRAMIEENLTTLQREHLV